MIRSEFAALVGEDRPPHLIFSKSIIRSNCAALDTLARDSLGHFFDGIYFPVKVAPDVRILNEIVAAGLGLEVSSERDAAILQRTKPPRSNSIVFGGHIKTENYWRFMHASTPAAVVVESMPDFRQANYELKRVGRREPCLLRLQSSEGRRLGLSVVEIIDNVRTLLTAEALDVVGVHIHGGSSMSDFAFQKTIDFLAHNLCRLSGLGIPIAIMNLGGGFPTLSQGIQVLRERMIAYRKLAESVDARVKIEPGRPIVGDAAILVADVIDVRSGPRFAQLSASANPIYGVCAANGEGAVVYRSPDGRLTDVRLGNRRNHTWRMGGIWPSETDCLFLTGEYEFHIGGKFICGQAGAYSLGLLHEILPPESPVILV